MPPPKVGTPGRQGTKKHQDTINFAYKQKSGEKKPSTLAAWCAVSCGKSFHGFGV